MAGRHRRLLSEVDTSLVSDSSACSVEDVLQLLQLLYAVSQDPMAGNGDVQGVPAETTTQLNVPAEEFYSKKITNKVVQQIQVSVHELPKRETVYIVCVS